LRRIRLTAPERSKTESGEIKTDTRNIGDRMAGSKFYVYVYREAEQLESPNNKEPLIDIFGLDGYNLAKEHGNTDLISFGIEGTFFCCKEKNNSKRDTLQHIVQTLRYDREVDSIELYALHNHRVVPIERAVPR
tara:strand:+ start:161 stop:562 length:402 start_codon:yes stop_codon:yes gene_type:complete